MRHRLLFASLLLALASTAARAQSAFSHRIELKTPQGVGGVQPQLALVFSPETGDGIVGAGWELTGLSFITRENRGSSSSPTFAHSELGTLVKQSDGTYRTERESFARFVASGTCSDGPCSWTMQLPSGTKVRFGATSDSVRAGSTGIRSWGVSSAADLFGNSYDVTYLDPGDGHLYPSTVTYNKGPGIAASASRQVSFSYEGRSDYAPSYAFGAADSTTQRLRWVDVSSAGALVRRYRLSYAESEITRSSKLVSVQEYGSNGMLEAAVATVPAPAEYALPAQTFQWTEETRGFDTGGKGWPNSGSFTEAVLAALAVEQRPRYLTGDFDGDGKQDVLYLDAKDNALYVSLSSTTGAGAKTLWIKGFGDASISQIDRYLVGDFNGDGKDDVLFVADESPANLWVALSTGSAFTTATSWTTFGNGKDKGRYRVGDFDGDQKADLLFIGGEPVGSTNLSVALSTGSAFANQGSWAVFGNGQDYGRYDFGDLDGDGRTDVVFYGGDSKIWVARSTGTRFKFDGATDREWLTFGNGQDYGRYRLGDFNGDGKTDLLFIGGEPEGQTNLWVALSTGDALVDKGSWAVFGNGQDYGRYRFADFNGDGTTDVLFLGGDAAPSAMVVVLSTGKGFGGENVWAQFGNGAAVAGYRIADFNGDGKADILAIRDDGELWIAQNVAERPRISGIKNGIGGSIALEWTPISALQDAILTAPSAASPGLPDTTPRLLVTAAVTRDGRGGAFRTTYAYRDARRRTGLPWERRALGFATVETIDAQTKQRTVTTFDQSLGEVDVPVARIEVYADGGRLLSRTVSAWEIVSTPDATGTKWVRLASEERASFELGEPSTLQRIVFTFDDYGNEILRNVRVAGLPDLVIDTRRLYDRSRWVLGRVDQVITWSGSSTKLAMERNGWSGDCLVSKARWLGIDAGDRWVTTSMACDANGNVSSVTAPSTGDGLTRTTSIQYDATFHAYPYLVTNAKGQVTERRYDAAGRHTLTIDPNGTTESTDYDVFSRPVKVTRPDGGTTLLHYLNYGDPSAQYDETVVALDAQRSLTTRAYFDGLRFKHSVQKTGDAGVDVVVSATKDAAGRLFTVSQPRFAGTDQTTAVIWYGAAGRRQTVTLPDGKSIQYTYGAGYHGVVDQNGHETRTYFDQRGVTSKIVDAAGQTTAYAYDLLGRLVKVTLPDGGVMSWAYDAAGRKTSVTDPHLGTTTNVYDDAGNLSSVTVNGKTTTFAYDALDRVTSKSAPGDDPVKFTYDETDRANGVGRLTTLTDAAGTTRTSYDRAGRVAERTQTIDGTFYTVAFGYDLAGNPTKLTYPDGSIAEYGYTAAEHLKWMKLDGATVATWEGFLASGKAGRIAYGNGVLTDQTYDVADHLASMTTWKDGTVLQKLSYDWYGLENTGGVNLGAIVDNRADKVVRGVNTDETQRYAYDALDRLVAAEGFPDASGTVRKAYAYDANGNPTAFGGVADRALAYAGDQVTSGSGLSDVRYDEVGNVLHKVLDGATWDYVWSGADTLRRVSKNGRPVLALLHGADGERVRKVYQPAVGAAVTTTYIGKLYERRTFDGGRPERRTLNLYANGQLIATVTRTGSVTGPYTGPVPGAAPGSGIPAADVKWVRTARIPLEVILDLLLRTALALACVALCVVLARGLVRGAFTRRLAPAVRFAALAMTLVFGATACSGRGSGSGGKATSRSAELAGDTKAGPLAGTLFFHRNHVNSSSVITDDAGNEVSRMVYLPFGEISQRNSAGADAAASKYTGQELDEESGLLYYRSRYYDPAIGRFLSADSVVGDTRRPSSFNRYAYGEGNPIVHTDPTGHFVFGPVDVVAAWFSKPFFDWATSGGLDVTSSKARQRAWDKLGHDLRNLNPGDLNPWKNSSKMQNELRLDLGFALALGTPWEMPQTLYGYEYAHFSNMDGQVRDVQVRQWGWWYDTVVLKHGGPEGSGVTMGPFVILHSDTCKNIEEFDAVPANKGTLHHELGHTTQSKLLGPTYLSVVGIPSLMDAATNTPDGHSRQWYEVWASQLGGQGAPRGSWGDQTWWWDAGGPLPLAALGPLLGLAPGLF